MIGLLGLARLAPESPLQMGTGVRAHWFLVVISAIAVATLPSTARGYPIARPGASAPACGAWEAVTILPGATFRQGWLGVNRELVVLNNRPWQYG